MAPEALEPDAPVVSHDPARWPTRRVLGMLLPLFLLLVFPVGFRPDGPGPNERAHAYLTMAIYQRGEVRLDQEVFNHDLNRDLVFRNGGILFQQTAGRRALAAPGRIPGGRTHTRANRSGDPGLLRAHPAAYVALRAVSLPARPHPGADRLAGRGLGPGGSPTLSAPMPEPTLPATSATTWPAWRSGTAFILIWIRPDRQRWLAGLLTGFALISEYQTLGIALVLAGLAVFDGQGRFRLKAPGTLRRGPGRHRGAAPPVQRVSRSAAPPRSATPRSSRTLA